MYEICGLVVETELDLPCPPAPGGSETPDAEIRVVPQGRIPAAPPHGEPAAELRDPDGTMLYAVARTADGYVLRIPQLCDVRIVEGSNVVTCSPSVGVPEGVVSILAAGTVVAFVLTLGGSCVLHASSVEVDGSAIGFMGHSGGGKSTMAAILCAAGAHLVTDDVLRVDVDEPPLCYRGSNELRLRAGAPSAKAWTTRATADGRSAVLPARSTARPELEALVVPIPDRDASRVVVERLAPGHAAATVNGFPRIGGWRDREVMSRQFHQAAKLSALVPVYVAWVPWGPPFSGDIADSLLAAL